MKKRRKYQLFNCNRFSAKLIDYMHQVWFYTQAEHQHDKSIPDLKTCEHVQFCQGHFFTLFYKISKTPALIFKHFYL